MSSKLLEVGTLFKIPKSSGLSLELKSLTLLWKDIPWFKSFKSSEDGWNKSLLPKVFCGIRLKLMCWGIRFLWVWPLKPVGASTSSRLLDIGLLSGKSILLKLNEFGMLVLKIELDVWEGFLLGKLPKLGRIWLNKNGGFVGMNGRKGRNGLGNWNEPEANSLGSIFALTFTDVPTLLGGGFLMFGLKLKMLSSCWLMS